MAMLSLQNPVFATYVIAATLMIVKVVGMSWLTVVRMMQVKGGFRSPEDLRKTPFNPLPNPNSLNPTIMSTASGASISMTSRMFRFSWWPVSSTC
jgi:hypothetical protein